MKKLSLIYLLVMTAGSLFGQSFEDSTNAYFKKYVEEHPVVQGEKRSHMHFFDADKNFRVVARFEKKENTPWIPFRTSAKIAYKL